MTRASDTETTDRPLKIAMVTPYDLAMAGGVNVHVRWLTKALRELGHTTRVYGPSGLPDKPGPGEQPVGKAIPVTVGGIVAGMGLNPLLLARVRRIVARERFDVIHVHEPCTPMLPWLFSEAAGSTPVVGTWHVHRENGHTVYATCKWGLKRWANRLDYRIAISDVARDTAARYFPGDFDVIPNGVDVARFRTHASAAGESATANGHRHANGDRTILFVGRVEPRKGLRYLVEAMPSVRERVPGARLVVVGDGPALAESEELARSALPDDAVEFVGARENGVLPEYYRSADVVCSPATHGESFGIVLLEAMAAERAIVATQLEGFETLVEHGHSADLVPPRDPDALAGALVRVLTDDARRRALGARASEAAWPYDWPVLARRIEAVYRTLL